MIISNLKKYSIFLCQKINNLIDVREMIDIVVLSFFSVLITGKMLSNTMYVIAWVPHYDDFILYFFVVVSIIKLMIEPVKDKGEMCIISLYSIVLMVSYLYCRDNLCWYILFVTLSFRNISVRKILKVYLITNIIVILCIVLSSYHKIIFERLYIYTSRRRRYSLGMIYCTLMPGFWLGASSSIIALIRKKANWLHYVALAVLSFLTWYLFDARTRMIGQVLLLFFVILINVFGKSFLEKHDKLIKKTLLIIYPALGFIIFVLSLFYNENNTILNSINSKLSGRLRLGYEAFMRYDIKLWGQSISTSGDSSLLSSNFGFGSQDYFYIDSSFLYMLLHYGLFMFILILCIYIYQLMKSAEKKNYYICAVLMMYSIVGMIEPELYWYHNNPFLFMLLCDWDSIALNKAGYTNGK